ncbi:WXG100 family type VII secretion target [Microbacterium sp. NPDC089189]|uniref:WXG100 family type VII secretion target n=1 Tax=Microbacterium sp. NPDC089189 TaxID=3154972 RepID=UPI00343A9890
MADLSVSGEGLVQLRDALARTSRSLSATLAELDERVAVLRSAWSGDASDAYDRAQREWTRSLDELARIVQEYSDRLAEIDARYRQASETIGKKIWR